MDAKTAKSQSIKVPIGLSKRRYVAVAVIAAVAVAMAGSAIFFLGPGKYPLALGRTVDPTEAIRLTDLLAEGGGLFKGRVVVRGRVGEVCRSAGCWFVLYETHGSALHELFVDLKKSGTITVQNDASGRTATVAGRLVNTGTNLVLEADGLLLE